MTLLRVGLIQLELKHGDPRGNVERVLGDLRTASRLGCDCVVLPELWNAVIPLESDLSLLDDGEPVLTELRDIARSLNMVIVAGSLAVRTDQGNRNRSYVIDRDGRIALAYDKVHLHPKLKEEHVFRPGSSLGEVEVAGIPCGVLICFDAEFPEEARALARRGAQVLFVPGAWALEYIRFWRVTLNARALENQLFVVGVNRCDRGKHVAYGGQSMVIDPFGDQLLVMDSHPRLEVVSLDLSLVKKARQRHGVLASLRPEIYRKWDLFGKMNKVFINSKVEI